MSDFDSLREDIAGIAETFRGVTNAQNRRADFHNTEIQALWNDASDLRDEVYAVANRLEALTAFVTSNPAEVAAAIVNDANRATAEKLVMKHGVPCTECGRNVYVDHLDPELPSPVRNADDGTPHTCHVRAVPDA